MQRRRTSGRFLGLLALATASAAAVGACADVGTRRQSLAAAEAELQAQVRGVTDALGVAIAPVTPTKQYCHMYEENGRTVFLSTILHVPRAPGALEVVRDRIVPQYQRAGWLLKDFSSASEFSFRLTKAQTRLNVSLTTSGRGDVVVGGSTTCFDPVAP